MKITLTLIVMLLILSTIMHLGDANMMSFMDYEELVRTISRGVSQATGMKDVAKELFTFGEATTFIANLPVK